MIIRTRTGDCIVAGRLSRDAEFSNVGKKNSPLTKFSIPARDTVQPDGSKQTEWISCEVWYEAAMNAAQLKKGDAVIICGQLSTHSYTTRNGETRTEECLRADAFVKASVPVSSASVDQLAAACRSNRGAPWQKSECSRARSSTVMRFWRCRSPRRRCIST